VSRREEEEKKHGEKKDAALKGRRYENREKIKGRVPP